MGSALDNGQVGGGIDLKEHLPALTYNRAHEVNTQTLRPSQTLKPLSDLAFLA